MSSSAKRPTNRLHRCASNVLSQLQASTCAPAQIRAEEQKNTPKDIPEALLQPTGSKMDRSGEQPLTQSVNSTNTVHKKQDSGFITVSENGADESEIAHNTSKHPTTSQEDVGAKNRSVRQLESRASSSEYSAAN